MSGPDLNQSTDNTVNSGKTVLGKKKLCLTLDAKLKFAMICAATLSV